MNIRVNKNYGNGGTNLSFTKDIVSVLGRHTIVDVREDSLSIRSAMDTENPTNSFTKEKRAKNGLGQGLGISRFHDIPLGDYTPEKVGETYYIYFDEVKPVSQPST